MRTVLDRFIENCKRYPERPAVVTVDREYSYEEFLAIVSSIRAEIEKQEHHSNPLIGVVTGDDIYTYASILAIMLSGAAYVPLNIRNPEKRNLTIIEETEIEMILLSLENQAIRNIQAIHKSENLELINTSNLEKVAMNYELPEVTFDSLCYLLFTSGSTGKPKGVPVYYRTWNSFMENMISKRYYDFRKEDRFLQMFELTFDLSVVSMFTPWAIGASVCIVPHHSVFNMRVMHSLTEMNVTVAIMVPSFLAYLRNYFHEIELPNLRYSIFCGEALPHQLVEEWSHCVSENTEIQNVYGPTEASVYSSLYVWEKERSAKETINGIVPIGKPMHNMEFYVVDERSKLVEQGNQGELFISGRQVTDGYWKSYGNSDEVFFNFEETGKFTYKTGDIVVLNDEGNYVFIGRKDSQVKVDGYRVELQELEYHAREYTNQRQVAAIAETNEKGIVRLHLFVEDFHDIEGLKNYMKATLSPFMVPNNFHVIKHMPLNVNGKLDRRQLKDSID